MSSLVAALEKYKRVLVVGGTGGLGRHIVRGFLNHGGFEVNVLVRPSTLENADGSKRILLEEMERRGAKLVAGDLFVPHSLVDIMREIDVVVTSISSIAPNSKEQHLIGEQNLIKAAEMPSSSVKYFIPAEFGGDSRIVGADVGYDLFVWNKRIEEILKTSGRLEYTLIYTSIFTQYLVWYFTELNLPRKTFLTVGSLDFRMSTITQEDIGNLLPHIVLAPSTKNRHIHIAGDVFSMKQLGGYYSEAFGEEFVPKVLSNEDLVELTANKDDPNLMKYYFIQTLLKYPNAFCFVEPWNKKYLPNYKTQTVKDYLQEIVRIDKRSKL